VPGLKVGHHTLTGRPTGCTVVLAEKGATAGVDVRGSAPGTRETDLLAPTTTVEQVHALVLSGGSAFGLDTASGVMKYLEQQGVGFKFGGAVIPIVPGAILFDLGVGDPSIRPTADCGFQAARAATMAPWPRATSAPGRARRSARWAAASGR
jgi:L-aminopeptidase/D-esterase-like protein